MSNLHKTKDLSQKRAKGLKNTISGEKKEIIKWNQQIKLKQNKIPQSIKVKKKKKKDKMQNFMEMLRWAFSNHHFLLPENILEPSVDAEEHWANWTGIELKNILQHFLSAIMMFSEVQEAGEGAIF